MITTESAEIYIKRTAANVPTSADPATATLFNEPIAEFELLSAGDPDGLSDGVLEEGEGDDGGGETTELGDGAEAGVLDTGEGAKAGVDTGEGDGEEGEGEGVEAGGDTGAGVGDGGLTVGVGDGGTETGAGEDAGGEAFGAAAGACARELANEPRIMTTTKALKCIFIFLYREKGEDEQQRREGKACSGPALV
uniref:Uncharacterized protein n=1 Tax=Nelumbo nucifera TaxID=4432 RepID=A0A822XKE5_NELNU|nr:TPA_asm: hypothetical protein HUJ06_023507 [Nelumbo nucifera]